MRQRRRTWSFLEAPEADRSALGDLIENVVAWAALVAFIWWACK